MSLSDVLMSAFAMFSLKDSALLEFNERGERDENLKRIYKIVAVLSDTQMRTVPDEVSTGEFSPLFKDATLRLARSKVLGEMVYFGKYYLLNLDQYLHHLSVFVTPIHTGVGLNLAIKNTVRFSWMQF